MSSAALFSVDFLFENAVSISFGGTDDDCMESESLSDEELNSLLEEDLEFDSLSDEDEDDEESEVVSEEVDEEVEVVLEEEEESFQESKNLAKSDKLKLSVPPSPTHLFDNDENLINPTPEPISMSKKQKQTSDGPAQPSKKQKSKTKPKEKNIQYMKHWVQAGCWFACHINVWVSPFEVIQHGMELANKEVGASQKKKKNDYNQLTEAWKLITDPNNPNFAVVCEYLVEDDISKLDFYAKTMKEHANQARSDDMGKLKKIISHLLADKSSNIIQLYMFRDGVKTQNAKYIQHPCNWGSFIYDLDEVDLYPMDSDSAVKGAFKSNMMLKGFKHIFNGSALQMETDLKTKDSILKIHKMNKIIECDLAYVAVQLCFIISSKSTWGETDAGFNLKAFYYNMVEFFEQRRKGLKAILEYWTDKILQNIATSEKTVLGPGGSKVT
ncbi:hypothetical protein BT96DRAFT_1005312 [Gymnopus androsaceus JB14]|uniref:Uncharacterized protein n=1 Tax=Gymnopus androsaceus JB14 TaxID=1447944 RepID=A0A6A4GN88_9AGAR|nr:hypothetical protein BT96DRAFT_1005312 [Gymnopus androsaceus JB14]